VPGVDGLNRAGRPAIADGIGRRPLDVLVSPETDPEVNLALEETLFQEVEAGLRLETLRLWVNDECLVRARRQSSRCGWHDERRVRELEVRVCIRSTGGGSVYHDRGNLNWSFYLRREESFVAPVHVFRACSETIIQALRPLGIDATFAPPNRIEVTGRKISGMAARATLHALLVHGTLLVSTDLHRLNAICIPPPDTPPVGRLCDVNPKLSVDDVIRSIVALAAEATNGPKPSVGLASPELAADTLLSTVRQGGGPR